MSGLGLGRAKTLGREEHVERPSFPTPNGLASNGKISRKPRHAWNKIPLRERPFVYDKLARRAET
jgi:hypothetical protein